MSEDAATVRNTQPGPERAAPSRVDLSGQVLMQKLKVLRLLGEGGMGAVYEVEHLITRHRRALKVMHARFSGSKESVTRFIREAGVAGTLKTPHVVETYDAGQLEDGSPYVLMELLKGEPLASVLERGPVPPGRMVGIACQVLEGLGVAHDAGIVHRDIKPDNLFVSYDDRGGERVRVLDFGISKFSAEGESAEFSGTLTAEGTMMGTPFYMSPEQASGAKKVDERSDLYSIGVVLYEGLAGRRPFEGHSLASLVIKIHSGEHVPLERIAPHLPEGLARVVERAMHVEASQRYQSARELLAELMPFAESAYTAGLKTLREAVGDAQTISAPAMSLPQRARPPESKAGPSIQIEIPVTAPARPTWVLPAAIGAAVAVALAGGWLALGAGSSAPAEPSGGRAAEASAGPEAPSPAAAPEPEVPEPAAPAPTATAAAAADTAEAEAGAASPEPARPRAERTVRVTAPARSEGAATDDEGDERPRSGGGRTKILRGGVY